MSESSVLDRRVEQIRRGFAEVAERVAAAARRVGRIPGDIPGDTPGDTPGDITIVAVTKRHPIEVIEAACAAGIRHVGENYAQELIHKLDNAACAGQLEWHFIGHLQSNKAKYLVGRTALIHALDSASAARELDKRMAQKLASEPGTRAPQRVLIAVNLAGEASKSGVAPEHTADLLAELAGLEHVRCDGFMSMPPLVEDPEDNRRYFRELAELRDRLRTPERPLPELSMGTTHDFEVAVEEGATLVRVGTAIFGERPE